MQISILRSLFSIIILSLSLNVPGLTLKIKQVRTFRDFYDLNKVIKLPKNTIIHIPDEYIDKHFKGDKRDQVALLNWLANARFGSYKTFNSKGSKDFFVEVNAIYNGKTEHGWVALRKLAKLGKLEIVTSTEANLFSLPPLMGDPNTDLRSYDTKYNANKKFRDSQYVCVNEASKDEKQLFGQLALDTQMVLHNMLKEKIIKQADEDIHSRRGIEKIIQNFNKTCKPHKFKDFYEMLHGKAKKANIPTDLLLGIMTQESSGKCTEKKIEQGCWKYSRYICLKKNKKNECISLQGKGKCLARGKASVSVGLMQVNTKSKRDTSYDYCSGHMKKGKFYQRGTEKDRREYITKGYMTLKDTNGKAYKVKCLENPLHNIDEAIRILQKKFYVINDKKYPLHYGASFNDIKDQSYRDKWRKAVSSYNGGSGWVSAVWDDIQAFNKKHSTDLDPDNWEIRKVFMLRHALSKQGQNFLDDSVPRGERRNIELTYSNLAYVESVLSNEREPSAQTQTSKWTNYVERRETE